MLSNTRSIAHLRTVLRAALLAGSFSGALWGASAGAGQASSSFEVSVTLLPAGTGSCSSNGGAGAPQVTCQPPSAADAGRPVGSQLDVMVLGYRQRSAAPKVAEPLVELSEDNYLWMQSDALALGEYSSRVVVVGPLRYVEMTVTW